jgi:hypothetical protein
MPVLYHLLSYCTTLFLLYKKDGKIMPYTIAYDCEVILDSQGYFLKPGSYSVKQPRIREAKYRADGSLSYIDLGPGRRTWTMTILAINELRRYDGSTVNMTGQQYRDALRASYINHIGTTINFTDPLSGSAIPVHFDHYEETIINLHSQIIALATGGSAGASYECKIELIEA